MADTENLKKLVISDKKRLEKLISEEEYLFLCFTSNAGVISAFQENFDRNPKLALLTKIAFVNIKDFQELAEKFDFDYMPAIAFLRCGTGKEFPILVEKSSPEMIKDDAETRQFFARCLRIVLAEKKARKEPEKASDSSLKDDVAIFLESEPIMLLSSGEDFVEMKGLLEKNAIIYEVFDVDLNKEVKEAIVSLAGRADFPLLYINGKLIGGTAEVRSTEADESLMELVPKICREEAFNETLKKIIRRSRIMLFMKGDRDSPRCGFSRKIVELLSRHLEKNEWGTFDVLENVNVRQGLKKLSEWNTFPQLYVAGELVGGLDVVKELEASGELDEALNEGAKSE